jgi:hypothetical protein
MSAFAARMDGLRMSRSERRDAETFLRAGELVAEFVRRITRSSRPARLRPAGRRLRNR